MAPSVGGAGSVGSAGVRVGVVGLDVVSVVVVVAIACPLLPFVFDDAANGTGFGVCAGDDDTDNDGVFTLSDGSADVDCVVAASPML